MSDIDRHFHRSPDPESEGVWSNDDGSCNACRDEAAERGDCTTCYGRGSFSMDEAPGWFECHKCKGTGRGLQ